MRWQGVCGLALGVVAADQLVHPPPGDLILAGYRTLGPGLVKTVLPESGCLSARGLPTGEIAAMKAHGVSVSRKGPSSPNNRSGHPALIQR